MAEAAADVPDLETAYAAVLSRLREAFALYRWTGVPGAATGDYIYVDANQAYLALLDRLYQNPPGSTLAGCPPSMEPALSAVFDRMRLEDGVEERFEARDPRTSDRFEALALRIGPRFFACLLLPGRGASSYRRKPTAAVD